VKERPILFSAPMVRAILEGRKTQTRRLVKMTGRAAVAIDAAATVPVMEADRSRWHRVGDTNAWNAWCPYGEPGDRLWVRERIVRDNDYAGGASCRSFYAADGAPTKADAWPWKRAFLPPMHCPRGLSRITLRVTSVRVERLQAITEDDARAEGTGHSDGCLSCQDELRRGLSPCRARFADLWDQINGERASWSSNPWVWVVGFEREATP
jgi:hypothetical protein